MPHGITLLLPSRQARLPLVVLDSLEAIDSERIAALVDYFSDYVSFAVTALLPEGAQALDDHYTYVTEI